MDVIKEDNEDQCSTGQGMRASTLRYRRIFEQLQEGLLILNAETGVIEDVNPYLIDLSGYSEEEFLGNNYLQSPVFALFQQAETLLPKLQQNEQVLIETLYLTNRNGIPIPVRFSANLYRLGGTREVECRFSRISEPEPAPKPLSSSETFNQKLVEASPVGILYLDRQGSITYENPAMRRMMGVPEGIKSPVIGVNLLALPAIQAGITPEIMQIFLKGEPLTGQVIRYPSLMGPMLDLELYSAPLKDAQGNREGTIMMGLDISERVQAEQARQRAEAQIRVSEAELKKAQAVAHVGNWTYDIPKDRVTFSDEMSRIFGVENDGFCLFVNHIIANSIHPEDREKVGRMKDSVIQGKKPFPEELRIIRPDGSVHVIWWEAGELVLDEFGQPCQISGIAQDITERKQADELLKERDFWLTESQRVGRIGSYNYDLRRGVWTASTVLDDIFGVEPDEPRTLESWNRLVHPDHREEMLDYFLHEVVAARRPFNKEYRILRPKDGGVRWVWGHGELNFDSDGKPVMMFGTIQDITERKLAEQETQRRLEYLSALSEIDRAITTSFDMHNSLSTLIQQVLTRLGADAACVLLLKPNTQVLEYTVGCGFRTKAFERTRVRMGDLYAGCAAQERKTVKVLDLTREVNINPEVFVTQEGFISYFCIPLISKSQVKGVLEVFLRKRRDPDADWFDFLEALCRQAVIAIDNATLFDSLQRSNAELGLAYDATIEGWSRALDLRDQETEDHTQRVTDLTLRLATAFGFEEEELLYARWGSLLHDIGKLGIPDEILLKPGPLTDEEWVKMRRHPVFAYEMLAPIRYLHGALDIPYCHHEKWDGSGYPRGLKGEQIPLSARIFAVVDVWDALSSSRPYRKAWPRDKVREYIQSLAGSHFDPEVVSVFLKLELLENRS